MVGSFILKAVIGLFAAVTGALGPLYMYGKAREEAAELRAVVAQQQRDMAAMRQVLNEQNDSVRAWKAAAAAEAERGKKAEVKAARAMEQAQKQARQIVEVKVPDGCVDSIAWAANASKELARVWK